MANEQNYGFELPEFGGLESPAPLSKINPTEVTTTFKEPLQKINQSREDYARALEERYSKPNWWKVMAGFAKPQLGGFVASLGSAGEALGEYEAQRRMVAPTIARIRAEAAAQELGLGQGIKGANKQSAANAAGRLLTGPEAGEVASLTQGPAAAGAAAQAAFRTNYEAALRDFEAKMSIEQLRLKYGDEIVNQLMSRTPAPSSSQYGAPPAGGGTGVGATSPPSAPPAPPTGTGESPPSNKGFVPGVPTDKINETVKTSGLPPDEQNALRQAEMQSALTARNEFTNTLGNQQQAYTSVFKDSKDAYKAFADPSLSNLFAIGQGPQVGDLIVQALAKIPVGTIIADAFKQAQPLSNDQKAKLESAILAGVKAVGAYQVANQLKNPTDAIREIEQYIPNFKTAPQETILRAFAVMGSDALYKAQQFPTFQSYINTKGNDARFWQSSEAIRKLQKEASQRSGSVLRDPIKTKTQDGGFTFATPKFFDQDIGEPAKEKASSSSTATERSQELQTASGRLVKIDGKWVRRP
jgi:hypothetical protein